jgi:orotidine-5'-phosphate decarboxylase
MQAAEAAAQETASQLGHNPPLVLGVTVLTSFDSLALEAVGQPGNVGRQVERLAGLAVRAGLRGLVCSPLELVALRQILPEEMQLVTPGIRGAGDALGDQKRTLNPREAMEAGATWLVIGRPICAADNPRVAAERILETLR